MSRSQCGPRHDEASIRRAREGSDATLDRIDIAQVDRVHLRPEQRRRGLDCLKICNSAAFAIPPPLVGLRMTATRVTLGAICLRSSRNFSGCPNSDAEK